MQTKYAGYMGKVMMVDLSTETVSESPWTDEQRELYLGGKIMAARILCDHLTGRETAFSEENWVVISTGPLTGTGAPSSARFNISALSPQTGILASSNCGGSFGPSEKGRLRCPDPEGKMQWPQVAGDQRGPACLPRCR
jgi:aldehyde:ferredoxin oxidoreductase